MSLVAARVGLRHRVTIERLARVSDGGGGSKETWNEHLAGIPCRAWTDVRRSAEADQGGKITVTSDRRLVVPIDTDVNEADRIGDVTDTAGNEVFPGPMRIDAAARHRTHIELLVSEVT